MELTGSAHRIAADKITKDRLPTTKYDLYNKVEFLADWPLLVDFYGCQPNLQSDEKPEGTSDERWAQGRTAANLLFQNHLTASVYKNICDSSQDTPHAKWTRLRTLFLDINEKEFLSNARTNLLECKQGPDVDIVEHTGEFNNRLRILRDLKDKSVEDPDWVFTIFKESLNITYHEILRPMEAHKRDLDYDTARTELLRLQLAHQVYKTVPIAQPSANVAVSHRNRNNNSGNRRNTNTFSGNCNSCGKYGHRSSECRSKNSASNDSTCFKCGETGHIARHCNSQGVKNSSNYKGFCPFCGVRGHKDRENGVPQCPKLKQSVQNNSRYENSRRSHGAHQSNFNAVVGPDALTNPDLNPISLVAQICVDELQPLSHTTPDHSLVAVSLCSQSSAGSPTSFVIDSGATEHMVGAQFLLDDSSPHSALVKFGNGDTLAAGEIGTLKLEGIKFANVLKIPGITRNLISEGQLDDLGCRIETFHGKKTVYDSNGTICFTANKVNGLYIYEPTQVSAEGNLAGSVPSSAMELWHNRLGHLNVPDLRLLRTLASGIDFPNTAPAGLCTACCKAKMTETPFRNGGHKANRCFEFLYMDVVTSFPVETPEGYTNSLTVVDKYSNYTWVENFRSKGDIPAWIIKFCETVKRENSLVDQILFFSSDKGGECINRQLQQYFDREGIRHQTAPARTSEYNGIAERANRTIGEMAQALRIYASLPPAFWGYARKCAAYIRNRCPSKSNPASRTPFEIRYGAKPDLSTLRTFGSPCFAIVKKQDRKLNQLADKAVASIFVGYDELERAYLVIPEGMRTPVTSRSVVFDELRAAEKAKHIVAAQSLSYGYEVPRPQLDFPESRLPPFESPAGKPSLPTYGDATSRSSVVSEFSRDNPRRSARLNFSSYAEKFIESETQSHIVEVVQHNSKNFGLLGELHWCPKPLLRHIGLQTLLVGRKLFQMRCVRFVRIR